MTSSLFHGIKDKNFFIQQKTLSQKRLSETDLVAPQSYNATALRSFSALFLHLLQTSSIFQSNISFVKLLAAFLSPLHPHSSICPRISTFILFIIIGFLVSSAFFSLLAGAIWAWCCNACTWCIFCYLFLLQAVLRTGQRLVYVRDSSFSRYFGSRSHLVGGFLLARFSFLGSRVRANKFVRSVLFFEMVLITCRRSFLSSVPFSNSLNCIFAGVSIVVLLCRVLSLTCHVHHQFVRCAGKLILYHDYRLSQHSFFLFYC